MRKAGITSSRTILEPLKRNLTPIRKQPFVHIPVTPSSNYVIPGEILSCLLDIIESEPDQSGALVHGVQPRSQTGFRNTNIPIPSHVLIKLAIRPKAESQQGEDQDTDNRNKRKKKLSFFGGGGTGGGKFEGEQALGGAGVGGAEVVGEGGGVDRRVVSAAGEVADGLSQVRDSGEGGGAEGAGGVILERLVAVLPHGLKRGLGNEGFEVLFGGDVDAALGDPGGSVAAGGANVVGGVEAVNIGLEAVPAGVGGVGGSEEEATAAEVVGLDEAEGLGDDLAAGGVEGGGLGGAEDGEVEGTRGG